MKGLRNWVWKARLGLMKAAVGDPFVLRAIENVIKRSHRRIEIEGSTDSNQEGWDVVDEESDRIEEMLGMAFLACQLDITRVISCCGEFYLPGGLPNKPSRQELMEKCSGLVGKTSYTQITAINAFANYFKHVDEWPRDWEKINPKKNRQAFETAKIVRELGARQGCSGNLREGFEAILGHCRYQEASELGDVVSTWAKTLRREYEKQLKRKNCCRARNRDPTARPAG